jgi:hypothetical protein
VDDCHTPVDCPCGYYCPEGSSAPVPCEGGLACPGNSSEPLSCPEKFYCPRTASPNAETPDIDGWAGLELINFDSPLFGYYINAAGEGTPEQVKALFAVAPNADWYGVGDSASALSPPSPKESVQDCANYAVQSNGDGFIYHGRP